MKIAVLSDIHANYRALLTALDHVMQWRPDCVVVAGDIVNRGPRPAECWQLVESMQRKHGWLTVLGNHEEYVINQSLPDAPRSGLRFELHRVSYWTYQQLGCDVSALQQMPFSRELAGPHGEVIRTTHGSMQGTRDGIYRQISDADLLTKIGLPAPALFAVGHTHQPLVRHLNGTVVVNAGAVGMPFDGDWRLSYAQLIGLKGGWHAEIVRLDYDRDGAERDFFDFGFMDEGGPLARVILRELQTASGLLFSWGKRYEKPVAEGELTIADAVEQFMQSEEVA